jgi:O2-independent ubiquinone biosynthesis accessory factor UbiT
MSYLQSVNHKVIKIAPIALDKIAKHTPKPLLKSLLRALLNQLFKQQLAGGELDFLRNKWVRITVTDLDFSFDLSLDSCANPQLQADFERKKTDLVFSSASDYLLLLALNKVDPDTLFFQRKLGIQGDTDLGLSIKNLLASLDLTGELPHKLASWIGQLADNICEKHVH